MQRSLRLHCQLLSEVFGERVTCELYNLRGSLENCHVQFSRDRFCPAWAFQSLRRPSLGLLSELEVWGGGLKGGNMWIRYMPLRQHSTLTLSQTTLHSDTLSDNTQPANLCGSLKNCQGQFSRSYRLSSPFPESSSSLSCPIVGSKRNKSKQHEPNEINGQPVLCNRNGVDSGKMDRFSALLKLN